MIHSSSKVPSSGTLDEATSAVKNCQTTRFSPVMLTVAGKSEILPMERHVGTIIMLHGMGETNKHWYDLVCARGLEVRFPHLKFVFPEAPSRRITLVNGPPMSAWFDVLTTNDVRGGTHDEAGLQAGCAFLEQLVQAESVDVPLENILLVGYSQGGALALFAAAKMKTFVGGVFAVSSYMPMAPQVRQDLESERANDKASRTTTFRLAHGTNDPSVKFPWAKWTEETLRAGGCDVRLISYLRAGHQPHAQVISDLTAFINEKVPYDISYEI
ncbi:Alpha/Beta hydrolase protein [Mycena sanguinolenta]|nr:Alpha/Beta hydrolase protein [Mycena sanguinolenta]